MAAEKNLSGTTYALMRFVVGFLFLWHGSQKLFGFPPSGHVSEGGTPAYVYVAGVIELLGGALIALGLFTRLAAFLCSGMMAVAYWWMHGTKALLPVVNGGELAVFYCFVFLFICTQGSGPMSIDAARQKGS